MECGIYLLDGKNANSRVASKLLLISSQIIRTTILSQPILNLQITTNMITIHESYFHGVDEETANLIIHLQLEDIEICTWFSKGKGLENDVSDAEVARGQRYAHC
jgi:hypothetical protein